MHHRSLILVALCVCVGHLRAPADDAAGVEFFEKRVRPILIDHCYKCHGEPGQKIKGGLRLDTRDALLKGGDSGKSAVVPGKPDESLLIIAVQYANDDLKMPPKGKLSDAQVADLVAWVKMGAPDPRTAVAAAATARLDLAEARKWWAYQPPDAHQVPTPRDNAWAHNDIDRFILARLEARGLSPAPPADRRTLIRRATFDLIGLPPTPAEVQSFLDDDSPDAFARVIDRLLASPRYGERWGRHWLDLVRYTDSFDSRVLGGTGDCADAWRYRDWVVKAFNADLPYDRFVTMQLAGDLLPYDPDGVTATSVLAIGNWGNGDSDKRKQLTDIVDDQVDLVGRALLGLTIACARCHDHKFDPISTEDYYGLAGIFFSSHINPKPGPPTAGSEILRIPLLSPQQREQRQRDQARLAELKKQIERLTDEHVAALAREMLPRMRDYLLAAADFAKQHGGEDALDRFAASRQLDPRILRQWLSYLEPAGASTNLKLFAEPVTNVRGIAGLHAWKHPGNVDTPSLTANSTDQPISFITITLPPKSVAIHPSPKDGVAVAWKSPASLRVRLRGRVADADPNCGNGIDWSLKLRSASGARSALSSGSIANGGAMPFSDARLNDISVSPGDLIELHVLPKGDYSCDTTTVELELSDLTAGRAWKLPADVVDNITLSNPHPGRSGSSGLWHFYDLAGQAQSAELAPDSTLFSWVRAVASKAERAQLERTADAVQAALLSTPPADAGLHRELTNLRSPFWAAARRHFTASDPVASLKSEESTLTKSLAQPIPTTHGIRDGGCPETEHAGAPHDVAVHIRGRYDRLGAIVPRRFPQVLAGDSQPPITQGSGRLQLAQWLTSPSNPQTARVMANRIWQHHFGHGLVRTPNNFGMLGTRPTHPELLDQLALKFVESGWSIKAMHRMIMLSSTYQQSSRGGKDAIKSDPDNLLFARFSRRRLEAEALRDALLAAGGSLDLTPGGPAVRDLSSPRRTLYLMTVRSDRSTYRTLFDAADPNSIIDQRTDSTVAPQALFLLNHPFVLDQANRLATLARQQGGDDLQRINWLYYRIYSRPPGPQEVQLGIMLLRQTDWDAYCHVLLCANEFVYVD